MTTLLALLLLAAPAWATSITISDTCPGYTVNNVNGVMSVACGTTPPPTPVPPPPLPKGPISCATYANTYVVDFDYKPNSGQIVKTTTGMTTNDILIARFTTTTDIAGGYGAGGSFVITDNATGSGSTGFLGSLNTTPCSMTGNQLGGNQSTTWQFNTYHLKPNTTYYVNILGDSVLSLKLTAK